MSPKQGRRRTSGKRKGGAPAGRPPAPVAVRRLGLLIFGSAFAILFIVIGIVGGIGNPNLASGEIAVVEDVPGEASHVTESELKHGIELAAVQTGLKTMPKPGEEQYKQVRETALNNLLDMAWLEGQAHEMGISVTESEIAAELKKLKKANFKTEAEFKKFVKKSHYTPEDISQRVKLGMLGNQIQKKLTEGAPKPSESEVSDYYEAAKATQFVQKASRDVRTITTQDLKKAEEAKALLEKDDSAKSWKKVATKYSTDATTKTTGGLRTGLTEGMIEEPVNAAIFSAPMKQVEGPVKAAKSYYVFEVERETEERIQPLSQVKSQIESQLSQRAQQEDFGRFVVDYSSKWKSRTFCASGYEIERCNNFKGSGHPSSAPPACYEANPKGGLPEACPAPVSQLVPALPGTISLLEPRGKPMAQRPRPAGSGETQEAASLSPGSVPIPTR